jgi:diguanylate cyclase (GGDEF)-like protein
MGRALRVLFVEDEELDIDLASRELERSGIEFSSRNAVCEASLRLELGEFAPDIVICDYSLPGFSGERALRLVRELCPSTPALLITGAVSEDVLINCLQFGATDYLLKSNLRRLGPAVRRAVDDARSRSTLEGRIEQLSHYDTLTGLPNVAYVHDLVCRSFARVIDSGQAMALVVVNIDRFSVVDEVFGRICADEALCEVGVALKGASGERDAVARVGSDEFVVMLSSVTDSLHASVLVQRLLAAVATPRHVQGHDLQLTASAGVALYPNDGNDFETLLGHASSAMHAAKGRQPGGVQFHSADTAQHAKELLQLESSLRSAVLHNELTLHYQPQFDVRSGRACGVEALARWFRPDGRLIPPSVFIPLAEQMGLISALGAWALEHSCATMASWRTRAGPPPTISVNVSTRQIDDEFTASLGRVLESTGLPAERLELEITESLLIANGNAALDCLAAWKRLGVHIAVDDFGTGYSSLSYLSRLPVDRLKIDKSLIQDMSACAKDAAIVRTVIALGHELGFTVLAEGVETEEQLAMLRDLGCQQAQGYLLARPMAANEADVVMARRWGMRKPEPRNTPRTRLASNYAM